MAAENSNRMILDRVAFFGRTLEEYTRFFDLDLDALAGQAILDCLGGASSFAAQAVLREIRVTAVDPQFANPVSALSASGQADIDAVMERVACSRDLFVWKDYPSIEVLRATRHAALQGFCEDFESGCVSGRYAAAALPHLPFSDSSFDLALSGHFLFLYCNLFPYEFHLAALLELMRVTRGEVRIYPLQGSDAEPYPQIHRLRSELAKMSIKSAIRPVPFEFQRGSTDLLALRRA